MRYQVTTSLSLPEALDQAMQFFGPAGLGLQIISQTHMGVVFQGGGGHVGVTNQAGHAITTLDIETREWDYQVQQFMAAINRPTPWWRRFWKGKRQKPQPRSFNILNN